MQQRGFPRAGSTDDGNKLALFNGQVDFGKSRHLAASAAVYLFYAFTF